MALTLPETDSSPLKIGRNPKRNVVLVSWRVVLVQTFYSLWCKPINLIFVHFPLGKGSSQPYRAWALHEVSFYKMMAQHLGYQTDGSSRKKIGGPNHQGVDKHETQLWRYCLRWGSVYTCFMFFFSQLKSTLCSLAPDVMLAHQQPATFLKYLSLQAWRAEETAKLVIFSIVESILRVQSFCVVQTFCSYSKGSCSSLIASTTDVNVLIM